jgi:hypothetical protein
MLSAVPIKYTNMKTIVSDSKKLISLIRELDTQTKATCGHQMGAGAPGAAEPQGKLP